METLPIPRPYEEMSAEALPWHTTLLGQYMQHNYWIYNIIDKVMLMNPQIKSIVEIGTGSGCVTTIFGLWGVKRNIPVVSIDNVIRHDTSIFKRLGIDFWNVDENTPETKQRILDRIGNKPTWIYCDGCCKSKELNTYSHIIPTNSIISAHDLGVEFSHDIDAKHLCEKGIIEPYLQDKWMELNIQLALYRKL